MPQPAPSHTPSNIVYVRRFDSLDGGRFSAPFATFDEAKRSLIRAMLRMADRCKPRAAEALTHAAEEINLESVPFVREVVGLTFRIERCIGTLHSPNWRKP